MAKRKSTIRQTMIYVANYISNNANRQKKRFLYVVGIYSMYIPTINYSWSGCLINCINTGFKCVFATVLLRWMLISAHVKETVNLILTQTRAHSTSTLKRIQKLVSFPCIKKIVSRWEWVGEGERGNGKWQIWNISYSPCWYQLSNNT
jgi:hypothetical protein